MEKCKACGAPLKGRYCEYCGVENFIPENAGEIYDCQEDGFGEEYYRPENQSPEYEYHIPENHRPEYHRPEYYRPSEQEGYNYDRDQVYGPDDMGYSQDRYWNNGYYQNDNYYMDYRRGVSLKSRPIALLLCIFLGILGGHYFYVEKIGMGILYLFTGGLFGIGWLVDIIRIATGSFTDKYSCVL